MRAVPIIVLVVVLLPGCTDDPPPHPSQQAVERAEKHADQAIQEARQAMQQVAAAEQEARHQTRLRAIDRNRYDAEMMSSRTEVNGWRAGLVCFSILLVVALLWLAREVRMRRVLTFILAAVKSPGQGGDP